VFGDIQMILTIVAREPSFDGYRFYFAVRDLTRR